MRIIRNYGHDDDHEHDDHDPREDRESRDPKVMGEILADEVSDFLAAAAHAAGAPFPLGHDAPTEPTPGKPVLRLVTTDDTPGEQPMLGAGPGAGLRPRLLQTGIGGSALVLAAVVFVVWGQAAVVAVPLAGYGLGWIAYLWWNAALRPPIPQVLAVLVTAVTRSIAAIIRGLCRAVSRRVARLAAARACHESARTTTA
ncbi:hypothetical protein [Nocardia huaxiensis]|uniref:Uncharacterized protein n=1 Tax=Nocardia huaxiensis TaxID=2755382 RepID=A0A7D6VFP4_9NOCA|nr:hypothetical protein [Nocardia huaxiensis]QLY33993.1 hypothetical protein H0264_18715 [Nocardia huaxiensis]UFS99104.1 hypothetical protein LPY97_14995 [Nocardia huaxiensis]